MKQEAYPLTFLPVYKDYVWGGDRIPKLYGRAWSGDRCAESWEISDHPDGMSVVANGPWAGRTFREVLETSGDAILGPGRGRRFPLLIKLIDARERLSIQVHPDDASAVRFGGEAKTECWYLLDAAPGACVYSGLVPGADPAGLRAAIANGSIASRVNDIPVVAGDFIFMPGGRVHAIGAGCLILEVQQSSNTTYRLYDWGRKGPDGRSRELHVDQALNVIRCEDDAPNHLPARPAGASGRRRLIADPHFGVDEMALDAPESSPGVLGRCVILFVRRGVGTVGGGAGELELLPGRTVLLPAALENVTITPKNGRLDMIWIEPGKENSA